MAAVESAQQVSELPRSGLDYASLHVARQDLGVVRQKAPVHGDNRLDRALPHLRPRRPAEGMEAVRHVLSPQLDQVVLDGM